MIFFLLLFLFSLLYAVSIRLTSSIYGLTFLVTKSGKLALGILTLILLPGTIVHEMSHFFMATILHVRTGKMTIFPEALEKGKIRAGKLEIGDCDPFRKTLIGIAPMIIGLTLIYLIGYFFFPFPFIPHAKYFILYILGSYLLITVSATMFSSPKDLESLIIVVPIITVIFFSLYFIGLRFSLTGSLLTKLEEYTGKLNFYLIITIAINFIIVLVNQWGISLFGKILGRKLVEK